MHAQSLWAHPGLCDAEIERSDVVELNLTVAREIPGLERIDIAHYCRVVAGWAERFRAELPAMEGRFHATPHNWKNDIRFFRVGMLQGFLGTRIGIRYKDEQKHVRAVRYTNPSDLFLNGLIDTLQGTCGNMAALHVAMSRRMGWPVTLACASAHLLSRYDDGQAIHNIEATSTHPGTFTSDSDVEYMERFKLPNKAIECGSDLRRLSMREMLGVFVALRARHYCDAGDWDRADQSYCMARVLFPQRRYTYVSAVLPMLRRGQTMFEPEEAGHPNWFFARNDPSTAGCCRALDAEADHATPTSHEA